MSPPFIFSGHNIDEGLTPIYRRGGGGAIEVLVDNSSVQGVVAFGGWAFPIDSTAVRGHMRVGVRDVAGDRIVFDDNLTGEPPLDPPYYVKYITGLTGDFADAGQTAYRTPDPTRCINIANGARWEVAAGVATTRTLSWVEDYHTSGPPAGSPDTCPGLGSVIAVGYTLTATFTG